LCPDRAITDKVPPEAVPLLLDLFNNRPENETFRIRVQIAKTFLQIWPSLDDALCEIFIPTGIMAHIRDCIDEAPEVFEAGAYASELTLLNSMFPREESDEIIQASNRGWGENAGDNHSITKPQTTYANIW
jgi:hypothetical protein